MGKRTAFLLLTAILLLLPRAARADFVANGTFTGAGGAVFGDSDIYRREAGYAVCIDTFSSGGPYVYVAGAFNPAAYAADDAGFLVIKYDYSGNVLSSATFVPSTLSGTGIHGIALDNAGNVFVAGMTANPLNNASNSRSVLVKYSSSLVMLSSAAYSPGKGNGAYGIAVDGANNVYVTGFIEDTSNDLDVMVLKYDGDFQLLASTVAVLGASRDDIGRGIAIGASGNIFVTGENRTDGAYFLLKYAPALVLAAPPVYDTTITYYNGYGIAADTWSVITCGGWNSDAASGPETWVIRRYDQSSLAPVKKLAYVMPNTANGEAIALTANTAGCFVTGYFSGAEGNDVVTLRYDQGLNLTGVKRFDAGSTGDVGYGIASGTGGDVIVTGGEGDVCTVKYNPSDLALDVTSPAAVSGSSLQAAVDVDLYETGTPVVPVLLSWKAPGDNGPDGPMSLGSRCVVRYSSVSATGPWNEVEISTSATPPGTAVSVLLNPIDPEKQILKDKTYYFTVRYIDGSGNAAPFAVPLSILTKVPSIPANVQIGGDSGMMTVERGKRSGAIRLNVVDSRWTVTNATDSITVALAAKVYDTARGEISDDSAFFYDKNGDPVTSVTIPAGRSSTEFSFVTSTTAYSVMIYYTSSLNPTMTWAMMVRIVGGGITDPGLSKEGEYTTSRSSYVVMGSGDVTYIDFGLGETDMPWQVIIASSADFSNPLWTTYGWGVPSYRSVSWSGDINLYDATGNLRIEQARKGLYHVRILLGYGSASIRDDSLSIQVDNPEIWGTVKDGNGNGLSEAYISAYGPTCAYTVSDRDGNYRLAGLRAGSYYVYVYKYGYLYKNLADVQPGQRDIVLTQPSYIRMNARRSLSSSAQVGNPEQWVSVSIHDEEYTAQYSGMLHFGVEVSTSDNGMAHADGLDAVYEHVNSTDNVYTGGKWTIVEVASGTYTLEAELYGYTPVSRTVVVGEGQIVTVDDLVFSLKKTVFGTVMLPAAVNTAGGAWISIEAVRKGSQWADSWGSAQVEVGKSSGTYAIYGLDGGTYTLRARLPGYQKGEQTKYLSSEIETIPDIALGNGGTLSGTITVEGDTGDPDLNITSNPYPLCLNAWSPETYAYAWTQVNMSTSPASASASFSLTGLEDGAYWVSCWLNGFEMEGAVGWSGVKAAVSGGSGTLDVKLKRYSGRIKATIAKPAESSYADIKVYLQGGTFWDGDWTSNGVTLSSDTVASGGGSFDPATGVLTSPKLGTGAYCIKVVYGPNGLEKSRYIMVTNGQDSTADLDLSGNTFSVSGKVKIDQSAPPQRITDIAVLVDTVPYQVTNLGMVPGVDGSTTTFRVFALDYAKLQAIRPVNPDSGNVDYGAYRSGLINPDGSYAVTGLVPGVYMLVIPSMELDGNYDDGRETAPIEKRVVITTASVTVEDISIRAGYSIKGTVKLPDGLQTTAATQLFVRLEYADKNRISRFLTNTMWNTQLASLSLNFAALENSKSYEIYGLAPGDYALSIKESGFRQFANTTAVVKIVSGDVNGKNIQLSRGGKIKFKLRDADSNIIITPRNRNKMLPWSYGMSAMASPWVEGGWFAYDNAGDAGMRDTFELPFLPEGTYDLVLGQSQYGYSGGTGGAAAGSNETNYAAKTVTGVKVKDGLTVDLGTIDIRQGLTITGMVTNASGQAIPNIPVLAVPSLGGGWSSQLRGFTDINGKYSIMGLDPSNPYYDIIACPRVDPRLFGDYYFFGSGGLTYGEKTRSMVKIAGAPSVDFTLTEARGSLAGTVRTEDGGLFQNPDNLNLPTAKVFLQPEDTFPRTNPIGDIVADTAIDGTFSVETLSPGTYRIVILSGGYASYSSTRVIGDGKLDLGTVTLKRGARVAGKIAKPDGKNPSTDELRSITAATDDLSELLVGSLVLSGDRTVTGYELNGMQAGNSYNIMFLNGDDELLPASVGYSVPFSSYTKTDYNLTFQYSAPAVFSRARREGNRYTIFFELTGALRRSIPADDDLAKIITLFAGTGTLGDRYIAPDRKSLSCTYTIPPGENAFAIKLGAFGKTINPATGKEFEISERFFYYAGVGAQNRMKISNLRGGRVTLEGDPSCVNFGPGTFEAGSSTSTFYIDFVRAESLDALTSGSPAKGAPRLVLPHPAPAYPEQLFRAMQLAQNAGVSPFSSFYNVMLPAGVSRVLKKDATLTLQYAEGADPTPLNIYYYDPTNNVYLLENRNRRSSAADRTISASVNHASTFVILQANASVIQGTAYNGPLFVYNYPNPFSLAAKPVALTNATAAQQNQTIQGTMIHYGLPPETGGEVEIRIYNVAGELVRTINDGIRAGGSHYYTEWNGENDSGRKVASGVYIGRFTADKKNEKFFKMAVIK